MRKLLQTLATITILIININAQENEAKKLCDVEIHKEVIDKSVVKEQCIKTAKFYENEKKFGLASWYHLLGGNNDKNINEIKNKIKSNGDFSNIAHSCILKQNTQRAKELYTKFLRNAQIPWADKIIQYNYQLLLKLYPNQKDNLNKGLELWNEIYKPLLKVNDLYTKYNKAEKYKKYKKAILYLTQIINLQKKYQNSIQIVSNQYNLGVMYYYNKDYKKSLDIFHNVEKIYETEQNKEKSLGHLCGWIAYCYENLQNNRKSLEYYKKSLRIKEKFLGETHVNTAPDYNNIGRLYKSIEKYSEALEYYKKSLEIRKKVLGKEHKFTAINYYNIGLVYDFMGDYPKALNYYKKALVIRKKALGEEHIDTARSYGSMGGIYKFIGNYKKALEYYNKALSINEKILGKEHASTALSYHNIGSLYATMGTYPKALKYSQKALSIYKKVFGHNHTSTATSYISISGLYSLMEDYPRALKFSKKALSIYEKKLGKEHTFIATSYNTLGGIYQSMGNYPQALEYYKKQLAIYDKKLEKKHRYMTISYNNIGGLYKLMKNYSKAYKYAKKSYDNFIINRDKNFAVLNNKQKDLYLKSNKNQIPLLLSTAYLYKKQDKTQTKTINQTTLTDCLNYKGSINDNENLISMLYTTTKDKNLKSKIEELTLNKRQLAKLYQTLPNPKQIDKWKKDIKVKEKSINDIEQYLSNNISAYKDEMKLRNIDYKNISSKLKNNELYIDYAKAGDNYYIFTLDNKNNITFNQINKKDSKSIDKNVKAFRDDIDKILKSKVKLSKNDLDKLTTNSKDILSKLYNISLNKPLKDILPKYSNLIISTDGALRLLPFEAMYDNTTNKYLIESKNIRYVPSGKEFVRLLNAKDTKPKDNIVMFSNPTFDNKDIDTIATSRLYTRGTDMNSVKSLFTMRFTPLPGTKKEVDNIKTITNLKSKVYTQDKAQELNLLKTKSPKILHIATHGFFINDNNVKNPMLKSGIALSGANISAIKGISDGIVTSLKLSGLNLKGTELVVLSACQTGVVDIKSTQNVSGLNKAFIQAGAKNIVMSLWSVADNETSQLMTSFYKQLNSTNNYAKALQKAKLKMINKNLHPFYWGAFVVSGVK